MGRQRMVYRVERSRFPPDFPQQLESFKEASGLSWRLARRLRIDSRLLRRWKNGTHPDSANLVALFALAAEMGLLHLLLPAAGKPESIKSEEDTVGKD